MKILLGKKKTENRLQKSLRNLLRKIRIEIEANLIKKFSNRSFIQSLKHSISGDTKNQEELFRFEESVSSLIEDLESESNRSLGEQEYKALQLRCLLEK